MVERGNVIVESNKYHQIDLNIENVEMLAKNWSWEELGDQREKKRMLRESNVLDNMKEKDMEQQGSMKPQTAGRSLRAQETLTSHLKTKTPRQSSRDGHQLQLKTSATGIVLFTRQLNCFRRKFSLRSSSTFWTKTIYISHKLITLCLPERRWFHFHNSSNIQNPLTGPTLP